MNKLKFYMAIAACLLVTAAGIIKDTPAFILSIRLIITIIVFYVIGVLIEAYLKRKVFYSDNIDDKESLDADAENEA